MRHATLSVPVYRFSELSKEAQNLVLKEHSAINVDHEWWDGLEETALIPTTDQYKHAGLEVPNAIDHLLTGNLCVLDIERQRICFDDLRPIDPQHNKQILLLLGIPEEHHEKFQWDFGKTYYSFHSPRNFLDICIDYSVFEKDDPTEMDLETEEQKALLCTLEEHKDRAKILFERWIQDAFQYFRDDYDHLISDESIEDTLEASNAEFFADGRIYLLNAYETDALAKLHKVLLDLVEDLECAEEDTDPETGERYDTHKKARTMLEETKDMV